MIKFFRARNSDGRPAQQQAPAAPQDAPAAPGPAPRSDLGGGARLAPRGDDTADLAEMRGIHTRLLAEILLNAGDDFNDAGEAPEYAAEAYVRHLEGEVRRLRPQPRFEPKTGGLALTPEQRREQAAAYRNAAESGPEPSGTPPEERM